MKTGYTVGRYQMLSESERAEASSDEHRTKQILAEMRTRDPLWLNKGIAPKVIFETPDIVRGVKASGLGRSGRQGDYPCMVSSADS